MAKTNAKKPHPSRGRRIAVDPIRRLEDIELVKQRLREEPRNLLLFTLGINTGLRMGDLLRLKVDTLAHLAAGESITLVEQKTGKENVLQMNRAIRRVLDDYLERAAPKNGAWLFPSRKGGTPIRVDSAVKLVKKWTAGLPGNFGTHSLRKTWGYQQRVRFGTPIELITKRFGHRNPSVTMRYLGITTEEVSQILDHDI